MRIVSVWALTTPEAAAAAFSAAIRFNSTVSLDGIPADWRIGHRRHSECLCRELPQLGRLQIELVCAVAMCVSKPSCATIQSETREQLGAHFE